MFSVNNLQLNDTKTVRDLILRGQLSHIRKFLYYAWSKIELQETEIREYHSTWLCRNQVMLLVKKTLFLNFPLCMTC